MLKTEYMTPFQISMYYITHEREMGILEKSFLQVKSQLELYKKQYAITQKSYLNSWKQEAENLNKKYKKSEEQAKKIYAETLGDENPEDENNIAYATHVSGIDYLAHKKSEDGELTDAKYLDFLDLFSKSTLISLYSLNENFLKVTCDNVSQIFNIKVKISHFKSRDYLQASINYLELVANIETVDLESYISKLKDIQVIRNRIIHDGSKIKDKSTLRVVKKYHDSIYIVEETDFLKIAKAKFINNFFTILKEFYEEILWLLEEKLEYKTLAEIFSNWLGLIEGEITTTDFKYKKGAKKSRIVDFKILSNNDKIPELNGKLTLTRGEGFNVEVIDQTEIQEIVQFVNAQKESHGIHLEQELKTFLSFDDSIDIRLLIH